MIVLVSFFLMRKGVLPLILTSASPVAMRSFTHMRELSISSETAFSCNVGSNPVIRGLFPSGPLSVANSVITILKDLFWHISHGSASCQAYADFELYALTGQHLPLPGQGPQLAQRRGGPWPSRPAGCAPGPGGTVIRHRVNRSSACVQCCGRGASPHRIRVRGVVASFRLENRLVPRSKYPWSRRRTTARLRLPATCRPECARP